MARSSSNLSLEQGQSSNTYFDPEAPDLQPMELLHQFEMHTADTLIFGCETWTFKVIPLALKVRSIMLFSLLIQPWTDNTERVPDARNPPDVLLSSTIPTSRRASLS